MKHSKAAKRKARAKKGGATKAYRSGSIGRAQLKDTHKQADAVLHGSSKKAAKKGASTAGTRGGKRPQGGRGGK